MPSAGSSAAAAHIGWCEWLKRCEKSERGTHRFTRLLSVIGQPGVDFASARRRFVRLLTVIRLSELLRCAITT